MLLQIKNLKVSVNGKEILKGIDLDVNYGEVHAIMGPNGSGKSTLASTLVGKEGYDITEGNIRYKDKNLVSMKPEERARAGLFLAFQYPATLPGVKSMNFLSTALNEIRKYKNLEPIDALDFLNLIKEKREIIDIHEDLTGRNVNEGFSGGEKKKFEIFQMAVLEPDLAVLDETDSGLDIDSLKVVAEGVEKIRGKDHGIILITHYQRILNYITPDFVHVLSKGKIVKSGGKDLADELEKKGYGDIS